MLTMMNDVQMLNGLQMFVSLLLLLLLLLLAVYNFYSPTNKSPPLHQHS
jgi:flagellar biogenesis protein FliO